MNLLGLKPKVSFECNEAKNCHSNITKSRGQRKIVPKELAERLEELLEEVFEDVDVEEEGNPPTTSDV